MKRCPLPAVVCRDLYQDAAPGRLQAACHRDDAASCAAGGRHPADIAGAAHPSQGCPARPISRLQPKSAGRQVHHRLCRAAGRGVVYHRDNRSGTGTAAARRRRARSLADEPPSRPRHARRPGGHERHDLLPLAGQSQRGVSGAVGAGVATACCFSRPRAQSSDTAIPYRLQRLPVGLLHLQERPWQRRPAVEVTDVVAQVWRKFRNHTLVSGSLAAVADDA